MHVIPTLETLRLACRARGPTHPLISKPATTSFGPGVRWVIMLSGESNQVRMDQPIDHKARATKFRFKGQTRKRRPDETERESKRRRRNQHPDVNTISSETAFSESLFDALADDEGAAYWANIYGQPIHIYERPTRYNPDTEMYEAVSDKEYAAHVQQKMWAHTHAGALEEKQRRSQMHEQRMAEEHERERQRTERRQRAAEEERVRREMEEALGRGDARRKTKSYEDSFARYTAAWDSWNGEQETIPWPTGSGTRQGVSDRTVRSFFTNGLGASAASHEFAARLKEQRVRWHPDKMQQKLGGKDKVAKGVMADITMIFQVIDTLYHDFQKASNK